ncbi:hypothetical protein F511_15660 [Dorcoceras hygrometricum]|uniref:Uncharacterized protein n=1 Tax=Dorcoceras hygrometricum TaxID=472368 RepID=A0A2Z7BXN8_9LAMI|nr:hypothetical protein F511_15660 [Dorcoceras hygrometricum]
MHVAVKEHRSSRHVNQLAVISIEPHSRNGDRPAEVPVYPAWLPEDSANGQRRPKQHKSRKRIQEHRSSRHVNQLAVISIEPLYPNSVSTGKIIGTTHLSAGHNVALSQVLDRSMAQYPELNSKKPKSLTQKLKRDKELSGLTCKNVQQHWYFAFPLQRRLKPPNWYQSKELLKTSSAPPISLQTTEEIDGNLPEKGSNEQ